MLGIVVLNAFVIEYVFGIQGLGGLSLVAIQSRDIPVIFGTSLVIVLVGVLGNFVQDVVSIIVDPRVAE
nr:ABC transporter permease subunit [Halococcus thailandensis]